MGWAGARAWDCLLEGKEDLDCFLLDRIRLVEIETRIFWMVFFRAFIDV